MVNLVKKLQILNIPYTIKRLLEPKLDDKIYYQLLYDLFINLPLLVMILYQLVVMGYSYCYGYFELWHPIYSLQTLKLYFFNRKYYMGQHYTMIDYEQNIILYDNWVNMQQTIDYSRLVYACIIPILLLAFIAFLACFPEMEL